MKTIIKFLEEEFEDDDTRQQAKVDHPLIEVVICVLLGTLCNADSLPQIAMWAEINLKLLRRWRPFENGTPSHDTIGRVMALIKPEKFRKLLNVWNSELSGEDGKRLKQILAIDGKTIRGNGNKNQDPLHIVSIQSREDGACFGQRSSNSKGKEVPMIKDLLSLLELNGHVVTIDAIGTNPDVAKAITETKADYVLAVKGNQPTMEEEIKEFFSEKKFLEELEAAGNYHVETERARSQCEKREYYQAVGVKWLNRYKEWPKLASIGMAVSTILTDDGVEKVERRYYISSLGSDIKLFARAVRGHWSIESMHWLLDVVFREDASHLLQKNLAENMNIIRKWALRLLKKWEPGKKTSMKNKRYLLGMKAGDYIDAILEG